MDRRTVTAIAAGILVAGMLSACTLPRIIVLQDPLSAAEHTTLGVMYERQGERALAAREYAAAVHRDGRFVPALMGLGNVAFADRKLADAESYYLQAIAVHPDHAGAANNLAMVYLGQPGRLDEAETWAARALAHAGVLKPQVLDTLAHVYARQGRCAEAGLALEQAQAAVPPDDHSLRDTLHASAETLGGCLRHAKH